MLKKILKGLGTALFVVFLVVMGTISYKAWDPFRGNEKVPEVLRDYATADFLGYQPYVVLSGSMRGDKSDNFNEGDVIVTKLLKDSDEVAVGDVVSYTMGDPMERVVIIHRIVAINEDGTYTFKGDANYCDAVDENGVCGDPYPVSREQLQATYLFKIPYLGWAIQFISQYRFIIIAVFIVLFAGSSIVEIIKEGDEEDEDEDDEDDAEACPDKLEPAEEDSKKNESANEEKNGEEDGK